LTQIGYKFNTNMAEEKGLQVNTKKAEAPVAAPAEAKAAVTAPVAVEKKNVAAGAAEGSYSRKKDSKGKKGTVRRRGEGMPEEFEQKMIDIARVTRVMAGGKRMRFRACVAIGNKKGRVAIGLAKGADVTGAVTKAVNKAKKQFIDIPLVKETIPHEVFQKLGAAKILLKPAQRGHGIIAGGVARIILELGGIKDVTSKILGSGNKVNNAKCLMAALKNLRKPEPKSAKAEKAKPELTTLAEVKTSEK
jgi:small subunit ribosomal protein S5